ncbi:type III pantothenate kinase [Sphaerotilus hippei]|uniref:Type III pantothenate kinase n=1 Tax=Sphaerotilus hippei TaxID=744406 RepID=A0A318GZT1_9BURK|nr:type III pantothenate kinase [Sphaerotilus hippei]PXW95794.1 type III pantothenate kinase [Sphaerotilus hippei]
MSFLVIDIGNTRLKWGLYAAPRTDSVLQAEGAVYLETIDQLAETDWRHLPAPQGMLGCAVAGQAVRRRVEEQLELWDLLPRWVVSQSAGGGVVNHYEHPARLGSDRWAALVGARSRLLASGPPRPALVVMVGTAVTVDALDAAGHFLGGLILPGFGLMLKALENGTSGLKVPTGEVQDFPRNTSDALMSGGTDAIAGAIERMHRRLVARTGQVPELYMTGGAAVKLVPSLDLPVQQRDHLIFDGLLRLASDLPTVATPLV